MLFVYWFLWPLRYLLWLLGVGRWVHKSVNPTSWVDVATLLAVLSRTAIAVKSNFFVALFVLSLCPFDISVGVGAFVIGLGQISSFLSSHRLSLLSFAFCSIRVTRPKICKKSVCFYCIFSSLSLWMIFFISWQQMCSKASGMISQWPQIHLEHKNMLYCVFIYYGVFKDYFFIWK